MIITNGQSDYLSLREGYNKVFVFFASGASGTLTPNSSVRSGELIPETLPNGDTTITGSTSFAIMGPGLLSFNSAGVTGTITAEVG